MISYIIFNTIGLQPIMGCKAKNEPCNVKLVTNYDIIFDMCKYLSTNRKRICKTSINRSSVIHLL